MLVTMKEILDRASAENYGVAAPNVNTELDARCALEAAEELNAPIILDVGFSANPDIVFYGSFLTRLAESSTVPVAINLDHGGSYEEVMMALRAGFTSVMVDRSVLPYEENVKEVSEIVKIAHAMGVSVEAELGHVGQGDNYAVDGKTALTDPQEAKKYIEETGVDMLAVAVGTAHGAYVGTPKLHFDRLEEIKKVTGHPLVLHGGSGSGDENLRKACQLGINKVNVCNDLMRAACDSVTAADLSGNGAYGLWGLIQEGWKARLKELIEVFGGVGKAWTVAPKGMPKTGATNLEEK
ncbi:MAG: class II fructose-bisphosphate aldolase [Acutalibacteraceae bacterium]